MQRCIFQQYTLRKSRAIFIFIFYFAFFPRVTIILFFTQFHEWFVSLCRSFFPRLKWRRKRFSHVAVITRTSSFDYSRRKLAHASQFFLSLRSTSRSTLQETSARLRSLSLSLWLFLSATRHEYGARALHNALRTLNGRPRTSHPQKLPLERSECDRRSNRLVHEQKFRYVFSTVCLRRRLRERTTDISRYIAAHVLFVNSYKVNSKFIQSFSIKCSVR